MTSATASEDRFIDFTFTIEWSLAASSNPCGAFTLKVPECFSTRTRFNTIPVSKKTGSETLMASPCIDDFFIDRACRSPFTFALSFTGGGATIPDATLLLDGGVFFLVDRLDHAITGRFPGFEYVRLSISLEAALCEPESLEPFGLTFLHLLELNDIDPQQSPGFLVCQLNNSERRLPVSDSGLDFAIPILYRRQTDVRIEYHKPDVEPFQFCEFQLLPQRDATVELRDASGALPRLSLALSVIDLSPKEVEERAPIARPHPDKVRPKKTAVDLQADDIEKILALEPPSTEFHRWIFSCTRDCGWFHATEIVALVNNHHQDLLSRRHLAPEFRLSIREVPDLITGFHFVSPTEQLLVLETRVKAPKAATSALEDYLKGLPRVVHALGDKREKFEAPRLYCLFNHLVRRITVPMGISDLLRLEGLYIRHSSLYKLCGVVNKLNALMGATSISQAVNDLILPTHRELAGLIASLNSLYSAPLQNGISTRVCQLSKGNLGDDEHSHHRSHLKTDEAESSSDFPVVPPESPATPSPRRLTTYLFGGVRGDRTRPETEVTGDLGLVGVLEPKARRAIWKPNKLEMQRAKVRCIASQRSAIRPKPRNGAFSKSTQSLLEPSLPPV
jgi:hypothetical protein